MAGRMVVGDMPTFASSAYHSTAYEPGNFAVPMNAVIGGAPAQFDLSAAFHEGAAALGARGNLQTQRFFQEIKDLGHRSQQQNPREVALEAIQEALMANVARRLVQVYIVDPNENVPLEQCLLYEGKTKLTDLDDQELFFEIDIKSILDTWNANRIKIINKQVKDRTEFLEPVKIRELRMVVVNIATF